MHTIQGMEVWGQTKVSEERTLIINSRQSLSYSSFLCHPYNNSLEKEELNDFLKASAEQLPAEIKKNIATIFVRLYLLENNLNDIRSDYLGALNLLCRSQNMCPLTIGNKTFEWKDIIVLKREQQDKLFVMGNPDSCYTCLTGFDNHYIERSENCCKGCPKYCCGVPLPVVAGNFCTKAAYCLPKYCCGAVAPDMRFLEDQPKHIKKNLIVQEANCNLACLLAFIGGFFSWYVPVMLTVCSVCSHSPVVWWPFSISFGLATPCSCVVNRLFIKAHDCCSCSKFDDWSIVREKRLG